MADIKFGRDQIKNPTPSSVNFWVRVLTIISGIFLGWMQTAPFIPSATQAIVSSILGLVIALGNGLAPLFGVTPVPNEIPSEKVTAMETDSTSKN